MNGLMSLNEKETVTMTSLEVVDLINKFREEEGNEIVKKHDVFLRDIRNELEILKNAGIKGLNNFAESYYINSQNKKQPCYQMNKAAIMQMLNKESALVRYKTQQYIEALENKLRESTPSCIEDVLISSLQEMKAIKQQLNQVTHNALSAKAEVKEIREIVSLDTTSWRRDTQNLINKIAIKQGGCSHINMLRKESYELLNKRLGVKLETRLTNRRRVMAEEGISKSKRDKLNNLDVIESDKKLIEGYVAIVKEMAIKYGI